jgi:hypothetical protein
MKKYFFLSGLTFMLYSCDSTTYESLEGATDTLDKVTYNANVKTIIDDNCIVCHSSAGMASFRPFNTYSQVKEAVQTTNLLDRIQRQNGETGQMPKTGRMPQQKIDLILQWNSDGLLEN